MPFEAFAWLSSAHIFILVPRLNPDRFFEMFYDRFTGSSPEVASHFEGVDMKKQRRMLMASLAYVSEFASLRTNTDYLKQLAERHSRREANVDPALYDLWLETLVETVRETDPEFTEEVGVAWSVVMSPGIAYMRARY